MMRLKLLFSSATILAALLSSESARAGDLKLSLPRRSEYTPVQKLNRDGVEAVRKHQYRKAESLFYKAYLYDPDDPFTLNNLGYIAELEGQVDRAEKFYALASRRAAGAVIDESSSAHLKGKPVEVAIAKVGDTTVRINQANVDAIRLFSQGRAREADALLRQSLALDPKNPFTLNNLGLAKEMEGDFSQALRYYSEVANLKSEQPVVVTLSSRWRGRPVSDMAAESAREMRERMERPENAADRAAELNLRGVTAVNQNDWAAAEKDFREAYRLNPDSAFSLNNSGFVAEMAGDPETAQDFYEKARQAQGGDLHVGVATRRDAEGMKLSEVAGENDQKMDSLFEARRAARSRETGPIELKRRDHPAVGEPSQATTQPPSQQPTLGPPQPPIPQLQPPKQPGSQNPPNPNEPPH